MAADTLAGWLRASLGVEGADTLVSEQEQRKSILIAAFIGLPVAVTFALVHLLFYPEFRTLGLIQIISLIPLLWPILHLYRHGRNLPAARFSLMLSGILMFITPVTFGGIEAMGHSWAFVFPFLAFFIMGQRGGWQWSAAFLLLCILMFALTDGNRSLHQYNATQILLFLSSLVFYTVIASSFNLLRTRFEERLNDEVKRRTAEAEAYLAKLQYLATHDELTGLPNHVEFNRLLNEQLAHIDTRRDKLLVMHLKLLRFLEAANVSGMDESDRMIAHASECMKQQSLLVARIGEDEFALVFTIPRDAPPRQAATDLLKPCIFAVNIQGLSLHLDYACGISIYPDHSERDAAHLLHHAEQAMLVASQRFGGIAIYDAAQDERFIRHQLLTVKLTHALQHKQLSLHYQAQVDLHTGKPFGTEALARWFDPAEGAISPVEFIPIAEQSGLITPFTLWLIDEGLTRCADWQAESPGIGISLNLSARSILDPAIPSHISACLQKCGLRPALVNLELTESSFVDAPEKTMRAVERLKALGCRLSVDDFGTGYSSLSYLKDLPVDELKIDKSFIVNLLHSERDEAIVRSTIELAHNLGMSVIAEGIEEEAVAERLRALGCDNAQGYHYSRPLPLDGFRLWLQQHA
jgi:diguanylate cyclase (GGDEF)-like protein